MSENIRNKCHAFVFNQLLPQWSQHGFHPTLGYSYESLTHVWTNNPNGRVRLLTQCRQLYTFSHAALTNQGLLTSERLTTLFEFIIDHYRFEDRWRFSLADNLEPLDNTTDCYALAFVMLSFSYYFKVTKDHRALDLIDQTHDFLNQNMRATFGGYYETYPINPSQIRRQNPHMHLLEGYIAAYSVTQKNTYKQIIVELLDLALAHFWDKQRNCLREFFSEDWQYDPETGHIVEPGHHFEWVWLLHQAYKIQPNNTYLAFAQALWHTGTDYGLDPNGGIYNQIDANTYAAIDKEKRIWPLTEYLKAASAHVSDSNEKRTRIEVAIEFAFRHYFTEDGGWHEYLDANNQPKDYPLPGTTSYHIFLGLHEVIQDSAFSGNI